MSDYDCCPACDRTHGAVEDLRAQLEAERAKVEKLREAVETMLSALRWDTLASVRAGEATLKHVLREIAPSEPPCPDCIPEAQEAKP